MSRVESLKEKGNTYFKNKDYKKAIQFYKEGLEISPTNLALNTNIAQAYLLSKKYSEAETHAVVSVALEEKSVKGYYRAAKAAVSLNKIDRALAYVRKGMIACPNSVELNTLLEQLTSQAKSVLANGFPENPSDDKDKKDKGVTSKRDRSRSTSKSLMSSNNRSSHGDTNGKQRTNSQSDKHDNESKTKKKGKSSRGPIEIEDIQNDKVLKVIENLVEEEKINRPIAEKADSLETIRKNLSSYMKEGSEALEKGLARNASEKYKSAIDIIVAHSFVIFGMKEIDCVILRYSLSISYIETANYNDIVKSLEYLGDIEQKHSAKLPAVYYALGNAYCKLNRFRSALEHLDKGSQVIEKGIKITTHPWPGTMNIIKETTKAGLQESLETLMHYCKTYREPDAICRYKKCLDISSHIIPSEFIFYSDPDYIGYVVVICEENCKITYHIPCWRSFKEVLSPVSKLSDKDMLGRRCLTSDCVNEDNEPSVIVKIEIYGDDGNIKSTCNKERSRVTNNNTKENKKEKKKKTDKTTESNSSAKTKPKRKKPRKFNTDLSSSSTTSKDVSTNNNFSENKKLLQLDGLRKTNFGYLPESTFSPNAEYFGRSDLASLESYLTPEYVGETPELKNKKEFVFTYFFEYINNEGPQKIKDIEEKWKEEVLQFHGVTEFMSENEGICNFLLQSYRFAKLTDYLCVASQLPVTNDRVVSELSEGIAFKLGNKNIVPAPVTENPLPPSQPKAPTPAKQEVAPMSPVPAEPVLENEVQYKDPMLQITTFPAMPVDSVSEMYFSDIDSSLSDSDDENDDNEEVDEEEEEEDVENSYEDVEDELEDALNFLDNMTILANMTNNRDEDDVEEDDDEHLDSKSDKSSINGLNPNAEEFVPPLQTKAVEKFYDDYIENGGLSKEKFIECISSCIQQMTAIICEPSDPPKDIPPGEKEVAPVGEPSPPAPVIKNIETQTEAGRNFEDEIEKLSADVKNLHLTVSTQAKTNEALQAKYEKDSERFRETIKAYDEKILALENERIKEIQSLKSEISKKDVKMESLKKKYTDQIDKLNKKVDDGSSAYKEMESKVKYLTEGVATLTSELEEEQQRNTKLQRRLLEDKNALGTYMVKGFRDRCSEKLQRMNCMVNYLSETDTPKLSTVEEAIKRLEIVDNQAAMIGAQFKIQYAILSEKLKHTGQLSESLDFFVPELPEEPACPLDELESLILKGLEKRNLVSPSGLGGGGDANILQNSHVNNVTSDARTSPHCFPPNPIYHQVQGQNLYQAGNPMQYRYGTYQTSAFGAPPAFAAVPVLNPQGVKPLSGYVVNGAVLKDQERKMPALEIPKAFSANDGPKPQHDHKSLIDTSMTATLSGFSGNKKESIVSKLEPISTTKGNFAATSKPTEKKKISSAAGLTPIEVKTPAQAEMKKPAPAVSTKPVHKPHPTQSSDSKSQPSATQKMWRYQKLLSSLKDNFLTDDEEVLADCLAIARERNNNTLSGLTIPVIYEMVAKVMKERSGNGQMAMDKFGGCPWGGVKEPTFDWNKPAEDVEECIICHILMTSDATALQCKHIFHTECVRQWLRTNSTCPLCRKYTTLNDEFPPLM